MFNRKESEKLKTYFQTVTKWIFTFSYPILLIIIILSGQILILFGQEFSTGKVSLILLCLGWIIHSAVGTVGQMLIMTGKQKLHLYNMIVTLAINIILNIIFIPLYGMIGAALATSISIGLFNLIELYQVHHLLKIQPYRIDFLKPIISGILATAIFFLLTKLIFNRYNSILIIIQCFIFFIAYIMFINLFSLQEEDKIILRKIRDTILSIANPRKLG